jgi:hypothetical protein
VQDFSYLENSAPLKNILLFPEEENPLAIQAWKLF